MREKGFNQENKAAVKMTRRIPISQQEMNALHFFSDLLMKILVYLIVLVIGVQLGLAEGRKLERNEILQSWSTSL